MPRRSSRQHNAEWLYYRIIGHSTGDTAYNIYQAFTFMITTELDPDGNKTIRCPNWMDSMEHHLFMIQVQRQAAEMGIILPDPKKAEELAEQDLKQSRYKVINTDGF